MKTISQWLKTAAKDVRSGALEPALVKRAMRSVKKRGPAGGGVLVEALEGRQMLANMPTVGVYSTNEDTQSGALVITDGGGGTAYYHITGITNGTLYQNDGTTKISNGDYITLAEGTSGLKFTPDANENDSTSSFGFTVAGSDDNAGLNESAGVSAPVGVTAVNDEPSFTAGSDVSVAEDSGGYSKSNWATSIAAGGGSDESSQTFTFDVTNDNNALFSAQPAIDSSGKLTFTPAANAFGSAKVAVFVQDSGGTSNGGDDTSPTQYVTITVTPVADTPSVTNSNTDEDTQSTTGLVVSRNAADSTEVTHFKITSITGGTLYKNDGTTQITNNDFITFAEANAGLKFTPSSNSITTGHFTVQASTTNGNGGLGGSTVTADITINPIADTPSATPATTNEDTQSSSGLVLSRNAADGAEIAYFQITNITNGTLYLNNGTTQINNNDYITFAQGNAGLKFTPGADLNSFASTFSFDYAGSVDNAGTGLGPAATRSVTVTAIADQPSITATTTLEDTQSTTGLVVTRNAVDGAEVTHFQITNITGGTLYKNNGTTQITNNSYITFAEANAGLKFTPSANLNSFASTFSFDVAGATSAGGAGLGPTVTASITVTPVADTPSATNATTNEDTQSSSGLVLSRAAVDGAETTHFKITAITNGTLYLNDGTTQINNGDFITFAQGNAGLKFTPDADLNNSTTGTFSFDFQAAEGNTNGDLGGSVVTPSISVLTVNDEPTYGFTVGAGIDSFPNWYNNVDILEDSGSHTISALIDVSQVDTKGGHTAATDEDPPSQTMRYYAVNITNLTTGSHFSGTPFNSTYFTVDASTGDLTYTIKANWYGTWTFQIQGGDTGGTARGGDDTAQLDPTVFTITVSPVADVPDVYVPQHYEHTVTDTTSALGIYFDPSDVYDYDTYDTTQAPDPTLNPLVPITNATTYYEITNVTNGTLYYNNEPVDPSTEIADDPSDAPVFINVGDGRFLVAPSAFAGLRFLPDAGLYNEKGDLFSFDIHSTLTGDANGFAGPTFTHPGETLSTATTIDIPVARLPDYVSDVALTVDTLDVTPGQRVFATVNYQNSTASRSFPQTVKIYRSSDGTTATLDELLVSTIIPGVLPGHGVVVPLSWIASVADADADGDNDGTATSFLVAIVDEEGLTGDGTFVNNWDGTITPVYTVTVPDVTIDPDFSDLDATEGLAKSGRFLFKRSGDTSLPLTITLDWNNPVLLSPDQNTTDAADFGGSYPASTVTFPIGVSTVSLYVTPIIDTNSAPSEFNPESLTVTVVPDPTDPDSYTVDKFGALINADARMTIRDTVNTLSMSVLDATATEKRLTTGAYRIARGARENYKNPVSVEVNFTGTATPNTDYQVYVGTTLYVVDGSDNATFTIPAKKAFVDFKIKPIDDALIEGTETVIATINPDPTGNQAYIPGATDSGTVNLLDNDDIRLSTFVAGVPATFASPTNTGSKYLRFTVTVLNTSTEKSATTTLQVGLLAGAATTGNYDSSLIPLQTVTLPGIAAGGKYVRNFSIALRSQSPIAPGTYRIAAKADATNSINETNETDNYGFTGAIITVS